MLSLLMASLQEIVESSAKLKRETARNQELRRQLQHASIQPRCEWRRLIEVSSNSDSATQTG